MMKKIAYSLLLLLTVNSCAQQAEDTIRLLPENYNGPVLIIFNQDDGEPKEYEGEKRIYRIPESGILKTQFKPNYGIQNHEFFYLTNSDERIAIPFVVINNEEDILNLGNKTVYAYLEKPLGKIERYDPETKKLRYTIEPARTFYIGNLEDIDRNSRNQLNFTMKHRKK